MSPSRLVEAAWARFEAEKAKGEGGCACRPGYDGIVRDRQVLYWLALTTGFRVAECAAIRWEDISFDETSPRVRLSGQYTNNGLDARVPLQPFVVAALKAMRIRRQRWRRQGGQAARGPQRGCAWPCHAVTGTVAHCIAHSHPQIAKTGRRPPRTATKRGGR